MQVNFTGILRTNIPPKNAFHKSVPQQYRHIREFENVLNGIESPDYSEKDVQQITKLADKTLIDYKDPKKDPKEGGIYRVYARDAIYYCTGKDIKPVREKVEELRGEKLPREEKLEKLQEFIDGRLGKDRSGFVVIDTQDGTRFDMVGMGEGSKDRYFKCEFIQLDNKGTKYAPHRA